MEKAVKGCKRAVVVFTKKDCPFCLPYMKTVKETLKAKKVTLAEVELDGDGSCEILADKHKVKDTPTLLYFRNGKLRKKMAGSSGNQEQDKKELEALISA